MHDQELAGVLVPATPQHPRPTQLTLGWGGARDKVDIVLAEATVTVEVLADAAATATVGGTSPATSGSGWRSDPGGWVVVHCRAAEWRLAASAAVRVAGADHWPVGGSA